MTKRKKIIWEGVKDGLEGLLWIHIAYVGGSTWYILTHMNRIKRQLKESKDEN